MSAGAIGIGSGLLAWLAAAYLFFLEIPWEWIAEDPQMFDYVPGYLLLFIGGLTVMGGFMFVAGCVDHVSRGLEKRLMARIEELQAEKG